MDKNCLLTMIRKNEEVVEIYGQEGTSTNGQNNSKGQTVVRVEV